jgi:membrane-associated PAP2 superfamily phosphatase
VTRRAAAATPARVAWAALALAAGTALLLPWRAIDPAVSRFFYRPETPGGPWQVPALLPWGFLALLPPWIAATLVAAGLALLAGSPSRRRAAMVLLLALALGPGLVVNALLKDHWHRPRPRQTSGLGGDFEYVAPFRIGPVGKSFPCGHSAVGFAAAALALAAAERRRRITLAAGGVLLGSVLGLGRIATGAHFLSDVVWSGLLTGAVIVLVDAVLPEEGAETRGARWRTDRRVLVPLGAATALAAIASVLLLFPFRRNEAERPVAPLPGTGWELDIQVGVGHARLLLEPSGMDGLVVSSRHDGFGVPWGRIEESLQVDEGSRRVTWRLEPAGWFADLEGTTILRISAAAAARVTIEVADGHLTLIDATGGAALPHLTCRIRRDALRLRGLRPDQVEVVAR